MSADRLVPGLERRRHDVIEEGTRLPGEIEEERDRIDERLGNGQRAPSTRPGQQGPDGPGQSFPGVGDGPMPGPTDEDPDAMTDAGVGGPEV
jgi:hypothetical protein